MHVAYLLAVVHNLLRAAGLKAVGILLEIKCTNLFRVSVTKLVIFHEGHH